MTVEGTIPERGDLPLRGREAEAGLLGERLAALGAREGGVVVVEGPAGSGRSRLLAETRALAVAAGLPCLHGAGVPGGLPVPFGPLLEALSAGPEPLPDPLALPAVGAADLRSWTLREIRDRLARSAAERPLVVCLDDVQWCDPVTLEALATLRVSLIDLPLLWVLAVSPGPGGADEAFSLPRRPGEDYRIVLGPLSDHDVRALAADLLQAEPGDDVMRVARRAHGIPQLVAELLLGMREEGLITVRAGVASTAAETIPRRFLDLVRRRLDQLSPPARHGLQAASVFGRAFTADELAGLTGASAGETAAVADEAVGAGLLTRTGTLLDFRHDLVREALWEALPSALRRSLRRQAAEVRLAQGAGAADTAVPARAELVPGTPEACGRALLLTASGQVGAALREADEGVRGARRFGHAAAALPWSMTRARVLLDAGRLAAARAEAAAALDSAGDPEAGDFADATARYALGRAAVHLGDRDGLRRCAADGARMMAAEAPAVRRTGAWLAALAADALGDTARVAELVEFAWQGADAAGPAPGAPPDPADHVVLARLAPAAGLPGLAAAAADRAAALDSAGLDPAVPLLRGLALQARGIVDDDPDLLQHAVKLLKDAERPLVHASAAEDAGRALGADGDPAAPDYLDAALDLYEESGAARDAARVRRRLRLLGVRRPPRLREVGDEARWGLTAAEARVARLVAQGATNRQVAEQLFLSRHTVNTHLRSIFAKWGIRSRVDLTRLVVSHEAGGPAPKRPTQRASST
ncbi:LuxR C-terminal-related transcriptional regulator [Actinomadura sp. NPDC000600]|uniref:ATP-binding protein n=1 Tax=Actinomadura sp. NPDC000600 TaxID=3154262 RepID=UPI003394DFBF